MEEELRKTLVALETGKRQMDQLAQQGQVMENAIAELAVTVEALNTIKGVKAGQETLVPIGAGSYIRAQIKDTETVLVGVGAGFSVEDKIPKAVETLTDRQKKLSESLNSLRKTLQELSVKMEHLNSHAQAMMGPQQP